MEQSGKRSFFARARKRGANHRRELITLLTPGQLKRAAFEALPNCMTLSSFLTAIHLSLIHI